MKIEHRCLICGEAMQPQPSRICTYCEDELDELQETLKAEKRYETENEKEKP